MDIIFKYELTETEKDNIDVFLKKQTHVCIEQNPKWRNLFPSGKLCYCIGKENGEIKTFSIIDEFSKLLFSYAIVQFGPVFETPDVLLEVTDSIVKNYRRKHFASLDIQLGVPEDCGTQLFEYKINNLHPVKYYYDQLNWTSIRIGLLEDIDTIFRKFSKGHKSGIKKTLSEGFFVERTSDDGEIRAFHNVYKDTMGFRGLNDEYFKEDNSFIKLSGFLQDESLGNIYVVKNANSEVVGGIITIRQGNTVRYYKGAADHKIRNNAILHIALWEAIKDAKSGNMEYFDFWGYNHFVSEGEQIYYINRFKRGFGGEFLFFPKRIYLPLLPLGVKIKRLLPLLKKYLNMKIFTNKNNC